MRTKLLFTAAALAACAALTTLAFAKWERIEIYRVGDEPSGVATGDLTGDGIKDVVISNGLSSYVSFFRSLNNGLFRPPKKLKVGGPSIDVAIGKFNRGPRDVVAINDIGNRVIARYGKARGFPKPRTIKVGKTPFAVAAGGLDGDRFTDLAVANSGDDTVTVLYGSKKKLRKKKTFETGDSPIDIAIGNVGGSKRADVVTVNNRSNDVAIHIRKKKGGFKRARRIKVGAEPSGVAIGHLGRGKRKDIAVTTANSKKFTVYYGAKNGYRIDRHRALKGASSIDIGKINHDKKLDVAITSPIRDKVIIAYGKGRGRFGKPRKIKLPPGSGPTAISVARLDFDPNTDMATANVDGFSAAIIHQR